MVVGLDRFREHFRGHEANYVLIGGVATQLALEEAGLTARATKDLDIVVVAEALSPVFIQHFWDFVRLGDYKVRAGGEVAIDGTQVKRAVYRFTKPQPEFPAMLELFSRIPDGVTFEGQGVIVPIPSTDDVSSLSAILLDDGYYSLIREARTVRAELPVLREDALIALKARAWLDLTARKAAEEAIKPSEIRKHATDILRLAQLFAVSAKVDIQPRIRNDLKQFLAAVGSGLGPRVSLDGLPPLDVPRELERIAVLFGIAQSTT